MRRQGGYLGHALAHRMCGAPKKISLQARIGKTGVGWGGRGQSCAPAAAAAGLPCPGEAHQGWAGQVRRCRKAPKEVQLSIIMSPMRRNVSFCSR